MSKQTKFSFFGELKTLSLTEKSGMLDVCYYLRMYRYSRSKASVVGGREGACGTSNYRNPVRKFPKFPFTVPINQ